MTPTEKAIRDFCGHHADWWPSTTQVQEMLALAKLEQKPVAWKLVPIEPTDEMLKAMDECSTEGYDERLYAGHAASVYMAAVDVAPTPPQRPWVGLTDEEIKEIVGTWGDTPIKGYTRKLIDQIESKLRSKN